MVNQLAGEPGTCNPSHLIFKDLKLWLSFNLTALMYHRLCQKVYTWRYAKRKWAFRPSFGRKSSAAYFNPGAESLTTNLPAVSNFGCCESHNSIQSAK